MKVQKQHKYDVQSQLTLGIGEEARCATYGKLIPFGVYITRNTYQFKRQKNGKMRYYCKYSCQVTDEKKDPPDKRRKWTKS